MTEVPRRLLVLGAGPVGVEMAQALRRMGASVALVRAGDHLLAREPRALGEALGEALAADGIELRFGQHATAVAPRRRRLRARASPTARELRGDRLLVATGRRAARRRASASSRSASRPSPHGIAVDARMTAGDGLWAIGDVTGIGR